MNPLDWLRWFRSVLFARKPNGEAQDALDRLEKRSDAVLAHADQSLHEHGLVQSARAMEERLARRARMGRSR